MGCVKYHLKGSGGSGATNFLDLVDTPGSYNLEAGKLLNVNALETGIEFSNLIINWIRDIPTTTLSPAIANDNLDMGTGNISGGEGLFDSNLTVINGIINLNGSYSLFPLPATEVADATFQTNQYSIYIDEDINDIRLKGKKSDSTVLNIPLARREIADVIKLLTIGKAGVPNWHWSMDSGKYNNIIWADVYKHYDCEILEVNNAGIQISHPMQKFATHTDLFNYINVNCSKTANRYDYAVLIKCYDFIDTKIDQITKIYGQNYITAISKGQHNYFNGLACSCHMRGVKALNFLQAIFDADGISHTIPSPIHIAFRYLINYTSSRRRFYGPISQDQTIWEKPSSVYGNILTFDTVTNGFRFFPTTTIFDLSCNLPFFIYQQVFGSDNFEYSVGGVNIFRAIMNMQWPVCMVYRISTGLDRYRAFLIKPVGIDQFWTNYYDQNTYDLEYHLVRKPQRTLCGKLPVTGSDAVGDRNGVHYIGNCYINKASIADYKSWTTQYDMISFCLRNKLTGYRGEFSKVKFVGRKGQRYYPFSWQIVNRY